MSFRQPMVTVDCVVFGLDERDLKVLLIQRGVDPFKSRWALPGGFVRMDDGGRAKTEQHIVAAMGLDDGTTNLRDVFRKMGIEDRWILTRNHRDLGGGEHREMPNRGCLSRR